MKVAVTGANGYIGSHVVNELLKRGHTVIATDMADNNINKQATVVLANIFETSDVFQLLGCPDAVIHMAWRNGFNHNNDSHIIDLPKHWAFTKHLIDAGCKSLTVMGTMHEIGYHIGEINENTPCNPMSLYGISKNSLRQMLLTYTADKDISLKWLRAFYVTGDDTKNKSIFAKILEMAAAGQKTFPFTTGVNQYDFTDINTLSQYIAAAATQNKTSGIINVCSGNSIALKDKVEEFIKNNKLDIRPEYGAFPSRKYDSPCTYGNPDKINKIMQADNIKMQQILTGGKQRE